MSYAACHYKIYIFLCLPVYMYVYSICAVPGVTEEGIRVLGSGVSDGYEFTHRCWKPNPLSSTSMWSALNH